MKRRPLVEDIQDYAQNIVDTVREPLLILDATLRVRSANRAFYQTFHVSPGETEGRLIYELGNGQWDIPDLRTLLEDIVPKSSVFDDFELEHTFPAIGRRVMLLNARKLQAGHHGELLVLAMEDVTAQAGGRGAAQSRGVAERDFQQRQLLQHRHRREGRHSDLQRRRRAHAGLHGRRGDEQDHAGRHLRSAGSDRARQGA